MQKQQHGFTLIELLVVITIIAILAAFLFANFAGARERTRDVKRKSELQQLRNALRLYYNDTQNYPDATSQKITCGIGLLCDWGTPFVVGSTTYMGQVPQEPLAPAVTYRYYVTATKDNFVLVGKLENQSDPDVATSQTRCQNATSDISYTPLAGEYIVCAE